MGDVPRPQEDAEKWRRALVKKIRQVEELLARRGRGEALNERQLEKVAREASLRSALAAAEAEGAGTVSVFDGQFVGTACFVAVAWSEHEQTRHCAQ